MQSPIPEPTGHRYTHRNHASDPMPLSFVCGAGRPLVAVWAVVFHSHSRTPHGILPRESRPVSSSGVCSVDADLPPGVGGSPAGSRPAGCPRWGCGTPSGSRQSPRAGRTPGQHRFRASELLKTAACFPHLLPFFRLAAIIFFFCKIFCKQQQKERFSNRGKERWCHGQETRRISAAPCHISPHAADMK